MLDWLIVWGSSGCVYLVDVLVLLGGCGDGVLVMLLIEFELGLYLMYYYVVLVD